MDAGHRTVSQSAVWKARTGGPYGMIPAANNQGIAMYVARGPQRAPELPATAWWMLMHRWERWQREEDEDED